MKPSEAEAEEMEALEIEILKTRIFAKPLSNYYLKLI